MLRALGQRERLSPDRSSVHPFCVSRPGGRGTTHGGPSWWSHLLHGFPLDRNLSIAGLVLTAAGTAIAVWQIRKVRGAAAAAREASLAATRTLRSDALARLVSRSVEIGRQISRTAAREAGKLRILLSDWMTASHEIGSLVDSSSVLSDAARNRAVHALTYAQGAAVDVMTELDRQALLQPRPDLRLLRESLAAYDTVMSGVVLLLEDAEVARDN